MLSPKTVFNKILVRLLFAVVTCASISLSRAGGSADALAELNKQCFEQNKPRACVKLGTTLWQTPANRSRATAAFRKGCELKEESACTLAKMPSGVNVTVAAPTKVKIPRAKVLRFAGDLDGTLSTARMEPRVVDGVTEGYRFVTIEKSSVFHELGFLPGDVITQVNDRRITAPADAMGLLPALLTGETESYAVQVLRNGQSLTLPFQITD